MYFVPINSQLHCCIFTQKSFVGLHTKLSAGENMAAQQETHCDLPHWFCSVYIGLAREKNASCWTKMLKILSASDLMGIY